MRPSRCRPCSALVEPQSSSLERRRLHHLLTMHARAQVLAYNGRETAPSGATPDMFLGADGKPLPFFDRGAERPLDRRARRAGGARAAAARARQARLARSVRRCRRLASDGFTVSPRLAGMIASRAPQASSAGRRALLQQAATARGWWPATCSRIPPTRPRSTRLAREGTRALYYGPIAAGHRAARARGRISRHAVARRIWRTTTRSNPRRCAARGRSTSSARRRRRPAASACCRVCCCSPTPTSRSAGRRSDRLGRARRGRTAACTPIAIATSAIRTSCKVPVDGLLDAAYVQRPCRADRRSHRADRRRRPALPPGAEAMRPRSHARARRHHALHHRRCRTATWSR